MVVSTFRSAFAAVLLVSLSTTEGFVPASKLSHAPNSKLRSPTTRLHFFGRKDKDEKVEEASDGEGEGNAQFFAFLRPKKDEPESVDAPAVVAEPVVEAPAPPEEAPVQIAAVPEPVVVVKEPEPPAPPAPAHPALKPVAVVKDPATRAAEMRAQAGRAREEAETMEAALVLSKIIRLEKDMKAAQKKGESTENLVLQIEDLQKKKKAFEASAVISASTAAASSPVLPAPTPVVTPAVTPTPVVESPAPVASVPAPPPPAPPPRVPAPVVEKDPATRAADMRAQAERVRLEADKMDAELTLIKISRLEKDMAAAQKKGDSTDDLLQQMDNLQRKMRGEEPKVVSPPSPAPKAPEMVASISSSTPTQITPSISISPKVSPPTKPLAPFSQEEFDRTLDEFKMYPSYLKVLLARSVGMQPMNVREINATEYAVRSEKQQRLDFSFLSDISPPAFTQDEIDRFKASFNLVDWRQKLPDVLDIEDLTEDEFMLKAMQEEYYFKQATKEYGISKGMAEGFLSGNSEDALEFSSILEEEMNKSQPYQTIESLFPRCVEKEGQVPTEAQVKMLISEVLPKTGFNTNAPPVEVFGGYLIRGDSKVENGDDLIDAIDASLAKSPQLRDKFTITYIKDISGVMGVSNVEFEEAMMTNLPRALYVMGPDVTRERNRLALSFTSAFGIATSWYLSIYPFLLNPTFMKRAEEQVALADASMAYDLTWLTDLSIPLFVTFIGLQLAHEAGHRVTAGIYGINITLPTFVPSLASGITSSITNLKSPAKNREQLFDFAIAGPLTGIVGSLIALYAGLQLTVNSDPATVAMFPALPLEILRQSSLGGGMIEAILGNGMLSIPDGAQGSQAIASMNVPLHPVALAGYISLIVNALSLLPIGSKWNATL
jgi:hypothetical protein